MPFEMEKHNETYRAHKVVDSLLGICSACFYTYRFNRDFTNSECTCTIPSSVYTIVTFYRENG